MVLGGLKTGQSLLSAAELLADEGILLYIAWLGGLSGGRGKKRKWKSLRLGRETFFGKT